MKALYRTAAAVLTLVSAAVIAILVSVATDPGRDIKVLGFTLFALGAASPWSWRSPLVEDRRSQGFRQAEPNPPVMNTAARVLLTLVLVLLFLFCTIAIVGAFNLDANETINTGRLILVIIGELIAIGGLVALWRGRARRRAV